MNAAMVIICASEMQTASTAPAVIAANVLRVSNSHPTEPVWVRGLTHPSALSTTFFKFPTLKNCSCFSITNIFKDNFEKMF